MALCAFDGTSKEDDIDDATGSNVVAFARAYHGRRVYKCGVGTRFGAVGLCAGRLDGIGLPERVPEALDELKKNFEKGDRVLDVIASAAQKLIARRPPTASR